MQKILLDTNVIVSALISRSVPSKILYELVLPKTVQLCLSEEVFAEYVEVLNRDKFSKYSSFKSNAIVVLSKLSEISTFYQIDKKVQVLMDKADNRFLELAGVCSADYLVTGNTLDFTFTEFESTRILTPRAYWDNFAPK